MGCASDHHLYLRKESKEFLVQDKSREYVFLETELGKRVWKKKDWVWDLLFCKQLSPRAQFVFEESVRAAEAQ